MGSGGIVHYLAQALMVLVPLILSLTVHEYAHALSARWLGDDTAERMGRLTLNPLVHADPVGTVGLPLLIMIANGGIGTGGIPFFGWAKPVPVNPGRFDRKYSVRGGMLLVAAAGPLSNLVIGFLCAVGVALVGGFHVLPVPVAMLLNMMIGTNIALFVFNMIPIYPLDGQKVLFGLLSGEVAMRFERFNQQFGWMLLMGIIFFASEIIAIPVWLVHSGVMSVVGLN